MSEVDFKIVDIGADRYDAGHAHDIATLHAELLGHSPLVLMGADFMESFYYSVLPAERLICGSIAYVNREPAGFIVATDDPQGFMSAATSRHRFRIAFIIGRSVLRAPSRLSALKEAYQIQNNVEQQEYGPNMGELLSFGVRPAYRSRRFIKQSGIHVGTILMQRATAQLRELGKATVRAIVDKDNLEAKLFYRSHGWRVGLDTVKGWRVPTMEFLCDLAPEGVVKDTE